MIETYKITSGTYDTTLPSLFQQHPDVTMETRGHSNKLYLRRANTNIRKNFFTQSDINLEYTTWKCYKCKKRKNIWKPIDKYWIYQAIIYDFQSNLTTEKRAGTEYSGMWPALRRGSVRICKKMFLASIVIIDECNPVHMAQIDFIFFAVARCVTRSLVRIITLWL